MKLLAINWRDPKHPLAGGAETHFHHILSRLSGKFGHEIIFMSNSHGGKLPHEDSYDGIAFKRFGSEFTFNFNVMKVIRKYVRDFQPDIIIEDVNKLPFLTPLFIKMPVMLVIPHLFSETIFKQTNFFIASYIYLAEKLMPSVYRHCHVHVISNSTKEDLAKRGYDADNISVAECGIEHEIYTPGSSKDSIPTVCYTGRLKKYKSVDHLLYAAVKVVEKLPKAKFIIIGSDDYLSELKHLAEKLGIQNNVEFPGYISIEDKIALLQISHCLAYTSIKEGWGISNIEANACGTPVVAADVPGLRDSVDNTVSGLLYEYGNIDDLAEKLLMILTDEKLRQKLDKGAVEWAKKFTWDLTANKFNAILQEQYPQLYY